MTQNETIISSLIDDGFRLISVTDGTKLPTSAWKDKEKNTALDLFDEMFKKKTSSIAMVCGIQSGNAICIDIDSKKKLGFDVTIINDFKELFTDTWKKIRVEKTPSGGYHFIYRIDRFENEFPRCENLAYRELYDGESGSKNGVCFLEIKAEGGITQLFPSINYFRIKDWDGGLVSWGEHLSMMAQCKYYNEIIKIDKPKISKSREGWYKEGATPFEIYNHDSKGAGLLEENGWNKYNSKSRYDLYLRPGKTQKETSAIYNRETGVYKVFTTNTELESKGYTHSSMLCALKFSGDWTKTYEFLVFNGYGELKKNIEVQIVEKAAKYSTELPKNISSEGVALLEVFKEKLKEKHPYGIFWEETEKGYKISRIKMMEVSHKLGFRNHFDEPVQIVGDFIKKVNARFYYDTLKEYIGEEDEDLLNCYEAFLQVSGKFTIERLDVLDKGLILRSSKHISYKFFKNCYISITKDGVDIFQYSELKNLIWEKDIKDRDYVFIEDWKGIYYEFLNNAIGFSKYLMKCIGFLAHDYRDTESYFIILTEKCLNEKQGGGFGKNIFFDLFNLTCSVIDTSASIIKPDNTLLQIWEGQKLFIFQDMPKKFDLSPYKNMINGTAPMKKLFKNIEIIPIEDCPKYCGTTNFSYDASDGGLGRRIRQIELTNFYKLRGGVNTYHGGKMFPMDWDADDLLKYDNLIVACIQMFLMSENIIEQIEMSDDGWVKQFVIKYTNIYDFIKENIEDWMVGGNVSNNTFNKQYEDYRKQNNIYKAASSIFLNKALSEYCEFNKISFVSDYTWRENGVVIRGRGFGIETSSKKELTLIKEDLPF